MTEPRIATTNGHLAVGISSPAGRRHRRTATKGAQISSWLGGTQGAWSAQPPLTAIGGTHGASLWAAAHGPLQISTLLDLISPAPATTLGRTRLGTLGTTPARHGALPAPATMPLGRTSSVAGAAAHVRASHRILAMFAPPGGMRTTPADLVVAAGVWPRPMRLTRLNAAGLALASLAAWFRYSADLAWRQGLCPANAVTQLPPGATTLSSRYASTAPGPGSRPPTRARSIGTSGRGLANMPGDYRPRHLTNTAARATSPMHHGRRPVRRLRARRTNFNLSLHLRMW